MKPLALALDKYQLHPQRLTLPLSSPSVFQNDGQLAVEIGFGGGEFLAYLAKNRPQCNYIGIELPPEAIVRASKLMHNQSIENVRLINGDARYLLRELFAPQSLDYVLMQFPMPWPKDRHAKHRVSSMMLTETVADVLKPGSVFELVSDQCWYAEDCHKFFSANPNFSVAELEVNPSRPFLTRYEKKWQADNRNTFRVVATLNTHKPATRFFLNTEMDYLNLKSLPLAEQLSNLVNKRFVENDLTAQVKEVMTIDRGFVLRMVAADDSFSQFFYVRIRQRKDQSCVIAIDDCPYPYYTPAVRFAIHQLQASLL
ncbi:MAG: tRNA (guanosine(46)-N7)-methyltransferase TrmB [Planctomycetes bacterium]|nr:tRNA (guanosine(46)-N7)-methyltransferase TrmB [Planctomycetota bacterium]